MSAEKIGELFKLIRGGRRIGMWPESNQGYEAVPNAGTIIIMIPDSHSATVYPY